MNKINLASGLSVIVLFSGLVSCSPEKSAKADDFKVLAPKIRSERGSVDWKVFLTLEKRELALSDVIETQNANVPLKGVTTCRIVERDISFDWQEAPAKEIPLFRILPREVLSMQLDKSEVNCSFEFNFYNSIGSRHIFNWPVARVRDSKEPTVRMELGTPEIQNEVPVLNAAQKELVKIRFASANPIRAELICRDLSFPSIPLDQVVEFDRFDFQNLILAPGKTPDDIQRKPVQPCRIYAEDRGHKTALSSLFLVRMPSIGLSVTSVEPYSNLPTPESVGAQAPNILMRYLSGLVTDLVTLRIQNDSNQVRMVRIQGKTWPQEIRFYQTRPLLSSISHIRNTVLVVTAHEGAAVQETSEDRLITLQPKGFISLNLVEPSGLTAFTGSCNEPVALRFKQMRPVRLEFISDDGLVASTTDHAIADSYLGQYEMHSGFDPNSFKEISQCPRR